MKKEKYIENFSRRLNSEECSNTFGSEIIGGNRTLTIKEVVITAPKSAALGSAYNNDGEDGNKPKNTDSW